MPTYGMLSPDFALSRANVVASTSATIPRGMYIYACVQCSYMPLCVKMKNLVVTISCACVTGLWNTSRFICRKWRCVWSRRCLDFLGEQYFQHPESSRRKWLQLQPTRWRICVTIVEPCLIWNISMLMSKTMWMLNYDDIMWMSNYEDTMCDVCWNYMSMSKICCNVFVNVSWCLRMWMWIDVCECNCECQCECVVVYEICVYMKSMFL
jgi:hypothetical protein